MSVFAVVPLLSNSFIWLFVLSHTSKVLTSGTVCLLFAGYLIVLVHSQHLGTLPHEVSNKIADDSIIIMCFISQKYINFAICQVIQL
jgi:hypothetical protein